MWHAEVFCRNGSQTLGTCFTAFCFSKCQTFQKLWHTLHGAFGLIETQLEWADHRCHYYRFTGFQVATLPPLHTPGEFHPTHWLSPPPLKLKSDCDGAIFHGLNCAGLGVVIRNSEGLVIAALSERVPLPPLVDDLEAMAWRRLVTFAIEIGLQDVIFEGDSKVVYKHLSATSSSMASFGHITDEI